MKPNSQDRPAADRAAPRRGSGRGRRACCGSLNGKLPTASEGWMERRPLGLRGGCDTITAPGVRAGCGAGCAGSWCLVHVPRFLWGVWGLFPHRDVLPGRYRLGLQAHCGRGFCSEPAQVPAGAAFERAGEKLDLQAGALDPGGARSHSALYQRWVPLARRRLAWRPGQLGGSQQPSSMPVWQHGGCELVPGRCRTAFPERSEPHLRGLPLCFSCCLLAPPCSSLHGDILQCLAWSSTLSPSAISSRPAPAVNL